MNSKKNVLINVRGEKDVSDPHYRYRMEAVVITSQGQKIFFSNIDSVCKSLERTPQQIIQFLKKHFGSSFDYKNNVASTTKDITKEELQNAVFKFIENYVLCKKCGNPETLHNKSKDGNYLICKACSYHTKIA
jgi:translation initiation factor 2 beta subunit (eIF-2beta)/eIF-5